MSATTCTELTAMWARDGGFRECVGCHELKSVGVQEDDEWICEDCDGPECGCCDEKTLNQGCGKMVNRGCCSDGDCNQDPPIEALCGECGTWDEEDEVWRCPDCQEEHEAEIEWEKREKCPCGLTLSDDDMELEKVHDVRLCEGCFEENKKDHEPPEPDGDGSGDE